MDRFTARRKLLRGSLAAPVVLTVASPSVLAQTTFTSCLVNGAPAPAEFISSSPDGYFRQIKQIFKLAGAGDGAQYYYAFDGSYYSAANGVLLTSTSTPGVSIVSGTELDRYFITYVDSTGAIKGWGFSTTNGGGSLAMQSCYSSLLIQPA